MRFVSSVPVLRMRDEAETLRFYLDFLGFTQDWQHRFRNNTPLYAQIRHGDAVLHLDGHATADSPVATVRFPVIDLKRYQLELSGRNDLAIGLDLVRPRGTNLELCLDDPSGNMLIFQDVPEPS